MSNEQADPVSPIMNMKLQFGLLAAVWIVVAIVAITSGSHMLFACVVLPALAIAGMFAVIRLQDRLPDEEPVSLSTSLPGALEQVKQRRRVQTRRFAQQMGPMMAVGVVALVLAWAWSDTLFLIPGIGFIAFPVVLVVASAWPRDDVYYAWAQVREAKAQRAEQAIAPSQ